MRDTTRLSLENPKAAVVFPALTADGPALGISCDINQANRGRYLAFVDCFRSLQRIEQTCGS